jgi:hypothetical protein
VKDCELPAFCRPVLVARDRDERRPSCSVELPLVLCCRHGRPGPVETYLSPSSMKRIERSLRGHGLRIDWSESEIELRWTAPALSPDSAPLAMA